MKKNVNGKTKQGDAKRKPSGKKRTPNTQKDTMGEKNLRDEEIITPETVEKHPEILSQMEKEEEPLLVPGTAADLTKEDMEALGPKDLSMDLGDDEELKHRPHPVDFTGEDLDVPGAELDDEEEEVGSEDEENNVYSLGGDLHDET